MICIIFASICLAICLFSFFKIKQNKHKISEKVYHTFSYQDYFETIEQVTLDILKEKEEREHYQLILWLGLDGLKLNDDGSTEWISRRGNYTSKPLDTNPYDIERLEWPAKQNQHYETWGRDINGNIVRPKPYEYNLCMSSNSVYQLQNTISSLQMQQAQTLLNTNLLSQMQMQNCYTDIIGNRCYY